MDERRELTADLFSIGAGAAGEKFATELKQVMENIRDANTQPDAKRKIVMEWEFKPSTDREQVAVSITARSVFASTKPTSDVLYVGKHEGELVGTVIHGVPGDPRQGVLPIPTERKEA